MLNVFSFMYLFILGFCVFFSLRLAVSLLYSCLFSSSWCFCRFPGTVSVSSKFSVRTYSNNTVSSNFTQRLQHWLFWGQKIWNLLFLVGSVFSVSLFNFTLTLFHFGPKGGSLETEDKASGGEFCVFHILVMSTSTTGSCFYLSSFSKEKT